MSTPFSFRIVYQEHHGHKPASADNRGASTDNIMAIPAVEQDSVGGISFRFVLLCLLLKEKTISHTLNAICLPHKNATAFIDNSTTHKEYRQSKET